MRAQKKQQLWGFFFFVFVFCDQHSFLKSLLKSLQSNNKATLFLGLRYKKGQKLCVISFRCEYINSRQCQLLSMSLSFLFLSVSVLIVPAISVPFSCNASRTGTFIISPPAKVARLPDD